MVKFENNILLKRAIYNSDRDALGRLHTIYYTSIKHYIASRINSISEAEDLSQNVFLEPCKGNCRYDSRRDAKAYLFGMAKNLVSRYYRNKKKHPQTLPIDSIGEIIADHNIQP